MKEFFSLKLEVPGHTGSRSVVDRSLYPPLFKSLHFIFDGWGGDHLLACFPIFIISEELGIKLSSLGLSGFEMAPMEAEKGKQMLLLQPELQLPPFVWLKILGTPFEDDFFLIQGRTLGVSRRALDAILATEPRWMTYEKRGK